MVVAVWDALENSPGYATLSAVLDRLFGAWAADALRAPFALGDTQRLRELFTQAQIPDVQITTQPGKAHFPSIASWIFTEIKGWTLADRLDDYRKNYATAWLKTCRPSSLRELNDAFRRSACHFRQLATVRAIPPGDPEAFQPLLRRTSSTPS